jgi:hypothetical protein
MEAFSASMARNLLVGAGFEKFQITFFEKGVFMGSWVRN